MSCEYCGSHKGNETLVGRGSRTVKIEKANETSWGIFMRWRTQNGKWHMDWSSIRYCPMCGEKLGGEDTVHQRMFGTPEKVADLLAGTTPYCIDCILKGECAKTSGDAPCMVEDRDALIEHLSGKETE